MSPNETKEIYKRLIPLYPNADDLHRWLNDPHPQLDGRRAVDSEFSEVMAIIDRLESGAYL